MIQKIKTFDYKSDNYNIRLYLTSKYVLLLDIFINKSKYDIIIYNTFDNIINYQYYKTKTKYYNWYSPVDSETYKIYKDEFYIDLNKIFPILEKYKIFSKQLTKFKDEYTISVSFAHKKFYKQFNNFINEDDIIIKW